MSNTNVPQQDDLTQPEADVASQFFMMCNDQQTLQQIRNSKAVRLHEDIHNHLARETHKNHAALILKVQSGGFSNEQRLQLLASFDRKVEARLHELKSKQEADLASSIEQNAVLYQIAMDAFGDLQH
jgi:glutamate mutase epsilon subunit